MPDFSQFSLPINGLIFGLSASVIWMAGLKMERQADAIARRTGLGQAFIGVLLLSAATSLPEITTTLTAISLNDLPMAVHNLLGSVVFNTSALAIADLASDRSALSHRTPRFSLIISGGGILLLLALVLMASAMARLPADEVWAIQAFFRFRVWAILMIFTYAGWLYVVHRSHVTPRWHPSQDIARHATTKDTAAFNATPDDESPDDYPGSNGLLFTMFAAASLVVLAAAWSLTQSGSAIATLTGLQGGFVGFAFLALATTLPEISTTVAAARAKNESMAFGNIFGSSAFVLFLLGLTSLFVGRSVFQQVATPAGMFALGLGMSVTLAYLWGLLEHEDRTWLRMGWDSVAVLILVVTGSGIIYLLEQDQTSP